MKWIDISHRLNGDTPNYPGDYPLEIMPYKSMETDHYSLHVLKTGMHTGTHLDMPMHLIDDHRTAADFPLDGFAGEGVLLDVRGESVMAMKPQYEKMVRTEQVVLLYTGWDAHYHSPEYFSGHPVVGEALGEFLLSSGIRMLGMDLPAPDAPPFVFHKDLLRRGIFVLENLSNLGALLDAPRFEVMAFPLKVAAEASLVRAVCWVDGLSK